MFFFISGKYTECRFTSTCFEQNIIQVAALNIDTLMQPLSVGAHDLENHFRCNGSNLLSYRLLQSFQSLGTLFVNLSLRWPQRKKSQGVKSGECGGHCVATGDPPFFINSSTMKARYSPDYAMVYTENGTYTAVRRRAPHHCTPSPPELCPSKIEELFLPHSV